MSKGSVGKKKGRSWSLTSSTASSFSPSPTPTPTVTTQASTLILTPTPSPDVCHLSDPDPFAAVSPASRSPVCTPAILSASVAPVPATDPPPPSPPSPSSTFGRLSSFKRRMARPIQRSYSQSHAHSYANPGLGQGATVVRTPLDATAHMQHASISHVPAGAAGAGRQKCAQYPSRQSSLRSAAGSPGAGRRPSLSSMATAPAAPRRVEAPLEGPAFEEERVEIQLLRSPKSTPRRPYQPGQSVDWSSHAPSHQSHQSLQFPQDRGYQHQQYQQYHQPARQSSQQALAQKYAGHGPKPSVSVSQAPAVALAGHVGHVGSASAVGPAPAHGASLSRSPSSQSSAGPQTPVTPRTPRTPEPEPHSPHSPPERPERPREREDGLDIDIAYHRHRLTSGTGRSSLTITAENAAPPGLGAGFGAGSGSGLSSSLGSSLGSHHSASFGARPTAPLNVPRSLRTHRSHASLAPSPSPSLRLAHAPSPSVASFTSIDEDVSPRVPGPMPRRRPSQTGKSADAPFAPVVVGHQMRPSTESSTLVTLRFAFSLDADPNTHTVTLTLDTLRPAGGRLVQFVEDALRPYSAASSVLTGSADSVNSVYSTAAYEGAPDWPDMTDGESAESAEDAESDFEYDPNPSYRFFQ